jgi:hypothetical protein
MKSVLQTDALSLAKLTQQNVLGPVLFNQSVSITQDLTVAGSIAGNVKFNGVNTLWNPAPELRFEEADQTDPNGRYRLIGTNGGYGLQKALSANWATSEDIWAYTTIGGFRVSKDAVFGAGLRVEGSTPDIRFVDWDMIDPAGRYRINVIGDAIHLQRALTANWATTTDIWNYSGVTDLLTVPKTVQIVNTNPILEFRETDIALPGGAFRWQASAGLFRLYANTAAAGDFSTNVGVIVANSTAINFGVPINQPTTFSAGPAIVMTNNTPQIQWMEGDQTAPAGQYRMYVQSDVFFFQRALTADFATSTTVWSYTASTGILNLSADLTFPTTLKSGAAVFSGGDVTTSGVQVDAAAINIKPRNGLAASGGCIAQWYNGPIVFQTLRSGAVQNVTGTISAISDAATKTDVTDATPKLADINRLRVVNYTSTLQPEAGKLLGFVAQEVAEVFPALVEANVIEDEDGNVTGEGPLAVKWSILVPALVKAVQELTTRLETLEGTPA